MEIENLMTKDWVSFREKPVRIEEISRPSQKVCVATARMVACPKISEIEPIPLTPEILEKNGFTNYGESWYIPKTEDHVMVGFHMYETTINISKDKVSFHISVPCKYRSCDSNRKVFVHELQHALRLCGITKEITI